MEGSSTTLAEAVWRSLEAEGVECAFGMPGWDLLPVYEAHARLSPGVKQVPVRHDGVAVQAAAGYAHATGRLAACLASTAGAQLVAGLTDAFLDSVPVLAIAGSAVPAAICKDQLRVREAADLPHLLHEAARTAREGRPGPVLLIVPRDRQLERLGWPPPPHAAAPARVPEPPDEAAIAEAARLIRAAKRPLFFLGGGVRASGRHRDVLALVEVVGAPSVHTVHGKGAVPDRHPQCLGMLGMRGVPWANLAARRADVVVVLGARFDACSADDLAAIAGGAKVVQVDVDAREISKRVEACVAVVADLAAAAPALLAEVARRYRAAGAPDLSCWLAEVEELRLRTGTPQAQRADGPLLPHYVIETLRRSLPHDTVVATGSGRHQTTAIHHWHSVAPRQFITSSGASTATFALPAAIGAQLGRPGRLVACIESTRSFAAAAQDLATAADLRLPLKVFVLGSGGGREIARLACAHRCLSVRARTAAELDLAIGRALEHHGGPAVIDVRVDGGGEAYWRHAAEGRGPEARAGE